MRHGSNRFIGLLLVLALVVVGGSWGSPVDAAAFPNDPDYLRQWGLRRIGAPAAWKTTKGKGVVVAVIDTGVNYRHPDLKANVLKKQRDVINDDGDALDLQGHGTSVAGVIAAVTNNRKGVAGVAPAAKILAVRAYTLEVGGFAPGDTAEAIMWAADNGADVINLSLGGPVLVAGGDGFGTALGPEDFTSIAYATAHGSLVVAAAGNGGPDGVGDAHCETPAIVPGAICVGATDSLDRTSGFSNYGLRLDLVAPGEGIYTTGGVGGIGYGAVDGTSFAAPMVSGVGALLMSMGADNVTAGLILRSTAKDLGLPGYDLTHGWGRLDAKAAVEMCKQIC